MLRKIFVVIMFCTLAISVNAQEESLAPAKSADEIAKTEEIPSFIKGRTSLRLGGAFGYSTHREIFATLSPRAEYFFVNRLSLGGQVSVSGSTKNSSNLLSIGPSSTFHFWNSKNLSTFVGAAYIFGLSGKYGRPANHIHADLGMNYNFNQYFGLGPKLSYFRYATSSSFEINLGIFFFI